MILSVLKLSMVVLFLSGAVCFGSTEISEAERQRATDDLISILKNTKYFDFVELRTHGIPINNPQGHYWWSAMWTGVVASKKDGVVTLTHRDNGSDNIGIHTSPYLEGACYAYKLTGDKRYELLARKLMRGFSSWILSSARGSGDSSAVLSRAVYPQNFTTNENGQHLRVDYEASRPGVYNGVSEYVHIPNNPYFGEIWLKNKRSTDDIGHMLRAIAQVQSCADVFGVEAKADLELLNSLYSEWAVTVDANNFVVPSLDINGNITNTDNKLGNYNDYHYFGIAPNCVGKFAVRMLHTADIGSLDCGDGISFLEKLLARRLQNDAVEILRTHHIAAVAWATLRDRQDALGDLKKGLIKRMTRDQRVVEEPAKWPKLDIQDIPVFFTHAFNVGVPLSSANIKFIYERLSMASKALSSPSLYPTFNLFDPNVPDGNYNYDAPNSGLYFYTMGPLIGTCSSTLRVKDQSLFDCDRLKAALTN